MENNIQVEFSKCIISGFVYIAGCDMWFLEVQVCYHKSDHATQSDYIPLCNILLRMYNKKQMFQMNLKILL